MCMVDICLKCIWCSRVEVVSRCVLVEVVVVSRCLLEIHTLDNWLGLIVF